MARPVNANAEATRRRILQTAHRLFSERGPGKASIRHIARESDVSLATVHHYFGSKQGLYDACINAMYAQLDALEGELAEALTNASGRFEDLVHSVIHTAFRFALRNRASLRLLHRDILDNGELDADRLERYQLPMLERTSTQLALLTGKPAQSLRLVMQTMNTLIARYALHSKRELALYAGLYALEDLATPDSPEEDPRVYEAVESHLVSLALAMLRPAS